MGLPHYILNLSAFDCIVKPIFRAVPRCELRLNKFSSFNIRFSLKT